MGNRLIDLPIERRAGAGVMLREWRKRRHLSQLDLALDAEISSRHLSFVETGRAQPSREMVLRLAERLGVPLRERNALLVAAGFAPAYDERPLTDPAMASVLRAIDSVLTAHEPYPALAIDRHWNLVAGNSAVEALLADISPELRKSPVNVLRIALHPHGLAPKTVNLAPWRNYLLARLRRQIDSTADEALMALSKELASYGSMAARTGAHSDDAAVAATLCLQTTAGVVTLLSTTTVFGAPADITLAEIALEAFYPADADSAATLRRLTIPSASALFSE